MADQQSTVSHGLPMALTMAAVARELSCSRSYAYRLARLGVIPTVVVGERKRVLADDLATYLRSAKSPKSRRAGD